MNTHSKPVPLGKGEFRAIGSLSDTDLKSVISRYRNQVASRYQAITNDNIKKVLQNSPFQVSPKVDGELWFLIFEPGLNPYLCAPNGRLISGSIPVLEEATEAMGKVNVRHVFAGELFVISKEGRPRVGMVASLLAQGKDADLGRLCFMAFDLVEAGSEPLGDFASRLAAMQQKLGKGKRCQVARNDQCADVAGVLDCYQNFVESGKAEGLVIRDANGSITKMKPVFTLDLGIIAFTDSSEDPSMVGGIMLALMRKDGTFQILGSCGNLGDFPQRKRLREELMTHLVPSDVRHASTSGALYRFVQPSIVVEIAVTDIQTEATNGNPILNRVVALVDEGWQTLQPLAGASLIHPVLVRRRDDKSVQRPDIRLEQLSERCLLTGIDQPAAKVDLPKSTLLRREVYTKSTRGVTSLRKLLCWKTNKESLDDFPAYVVHFTDYSPSRSDPLKREVRLAPTEEEMTKIAESLLEKNIKGGWSLQ